MQVIVRVDLGQCRAGVFRWAGDLRIGQRSCLKAPSSGHGTQVDGSLSRRVDFQAKPEDATRARQLPAGRRQRHRRTRIMERYCHGAGGCLIEDAPPLLEDSSVSGATHWCRVTPQASSRRSDRSPADRRRRTEHKSNMPRKRRWNAPDVHRHSMHQRIAQRLGRRPRSTERP